jgi:hypothetical protein
MAAAEKTRRRWRWAFGSGRFAEGRSRLDWNEPKCGLGRLVMYSFRCDAVDSWPSDTSWSYLTFVLCRSFVERTQNISCSRLIEHSLLSSVKSNNPNSTQHTRKNMMSRLRWIERRGWRGLQGPRRMQRTPTLNSQAIINFLYKIYHGSRNTKCIRCEITFHDNFNNIDLVLLMLPFFLYICSNFTSLTWTKNIHYQFRNNGVLYYSAITYLP